MMKTVSFYLLEEESKLLELDLPHQKVRAKPKLVVPWLREEVWKANSGLGQTHLTLSFANFGQTKGFSGPENSTDRRPEN